MERGDAMTPDDTLAAELDELNAAVRAAPDGDTSAQIALWQRVSRLDRWFFINRGSAEAPRPYAVAAEQGPMVCVYSSGARADEAARTLGLVGPGDSVQVLALPMPGAIDYLTSFGQSGVVAVTLDHPHIGHFIPLGNLGAVKRWAEAVRRA
jgi:hypothetical protein